MTIGSSLPAKKCSSLRDFGNDDEEMNENRLK